MMCCRFSRTRPSDFYPSDALSLVGEDSVWRGAFSFDLRLRASELDNEMKTFHQLSDSLLFIDPPARCSAERAHLCQELMTNPFLSNLRPLTSVLRKDEPDILFSRFLLFLLSVGLSLSLSCFSSSHRNWQNVGDDDRMGRTLVNVINKNLW